MTNIKHRITAAVGASVLAASLSLVAVAPANAAPVVQAKPVASAPSGPIVKSWWVGSPPWVACVALIGLRNGAWAKCTF